MKLETLAVVIKGDDNNVYEVVLNPYERDAVARFILAMHNGRINVSETVIDTIDLTQ